MDRHPAQSAQIPEVIESLEYDAQNRSAAHVLDGSTPCGEGSLADGEPDPRETFHYDAAGRLERIERDGQVGDVAPEDPDGKPDAATLLSAACDPPIALAPHLFGCPELFLPNSVRPPLR